MKSTRVAVVAVLALLVCVAPGALPSAFGQQEEEEGSSDNDREGTIQIRQLVHAGSSTTESFNFDGKIDADLMHGELSPRPTVDSGSHSVTQVLTQAQIDAGWALVSIACDDAGDGPSNESYAIGSTVTFEVEPNEDVLCTFTNSQTVPIGDGSIRVDKVVVGTGSLAGTFDFDGAIDADLAGGAGSNLVVAPGTYTVTETLTPSQVRLGWSLRSIACTSDASGDVSRGDVGTGTATFDVQEGENVVCTFTNRFTPRVKSPARPEVAGRVRQAPKRRPGVRPAQLPFTGSPLVPFAVVGLMAIGLGAGTWLGARRGLRSKN